MGVAVWVMDVAVALGVLDPVMNRVVMTRRASGRGVQALLKRSGSSGIWEIAGASRAPAVEPATLPPPVSRSLTGTWP